MRDSFQRVSLRVTADAAVIAAEKAERFGPPASAEASRAAATAALAASKKFEEAFVEAQAQAQLQEDAERGAVAVETDLGSSSNINSTSNSSSSNSSSSGGGGIGSGSLLVGLQAEKYGMWLHAVGVITELCAAAQAHGGGILIKDLEVKLMLAPGCLVPR